MLSTDEEHELVSFQKPSDGLKEAMRQATFLKIKGSENFNHYLSEINAGSHLSLEVDASRVVAFIAKSPLKRLWQDLECIFALTGYKESAWLRMSKGWALEEKHRVLEITHERVAEWFKRANADPAWKEQSKRKQTWEDRSRVGAGVYCRLKEWAEARADETLKELEDCGREEGWVWAVNPLHLSPSERSWIHPFWISWEALTGQKEIDIHSHSYVPALLGFSDFEDQDRLTLKDYAEVVGFFKSPAHMETFVRVYALCREEFAETFLMGFKFIETLPRHTQEEQSFYFKKEEEWHQVLKTLLLPFAQEVEKRPRLVRWLKDYFEVDVGRVIRSWEEEHQSVLKRLCQWNMSYGVKLQEHQELFLNPSKSHGEALVDVMWAWMHWNFNQNMDALALLMARSQRPLVPSEMLVFKPKDQKKGFGWGKPNRPIPLVFHWFESKVRIDWDMVQFSLSTVEKGPTSWSKGLGIHENKKPAAKTLLRFFLTHEGMEAWLDVMLDNQTTLRQWMGSVLGETRVEESISKMRQKRLMLSWREMEVSVSLQEAEGSALSGVDLKASSNLSADSNAMPPASIQLPRRGRL